MSASLENAATEVQPTNPWLRKQHPWSSPISDQPEAAYANSFPTLSDVMSEQLAQELQEEKSYTPTSQPGIASQVGASQEQCALSEEQNVEEQRETDSDMLLAQMLQLEYDKEHDVELQKKEASYNRGRKITLSFANYRLTHPDLFDDSSSESEDFDEDAPEAVINEDCRTIGKGGISGKGKNIITKHDPAISARKNASKMMEFGPHFDTGDDIDVEMKFPNHVYNQLKVHSMSEQKRQARIHDKKEKSTAEQALDPKTRLQIYKLINNEILESVSGQVSTGKEAVILHAYGGKLPDKLVPAECAIKVYKTTLNEFKTRDKYIKDDYRFKDRFKKLNPRKVIRMWAEKEMHNLMRMRKVGISCPEVVFLKKHILVMSFIGTDQKPAPKLKEAKLSHDQLEQAYVECVQMMKKLYDEAGLVHSDLSEYNILWHQGQLWFIDVSQSVEPQHPNALEFLLRDCTNVSEFFTKRGAADVLAPQRLFNEISGLDLAEGETGDFLLQLQQFQKQRYLHERAHEASEDYPFDFFFEKSCAELSQGVTKKGEGSATKPDGKIDVDEI
ncbi:PREDICTED: serine/threonine-protein kinase RIO3-like [Priapulus caudatus]|uniref:Serine/threonine-protein kinase RIO3 n=1 Tax=Priapulus caudatus TaxID=37621 RepID=A0ABM1EN47_PRICU|nr:PREDICTED: serine/threonine-protein kinase RIO3-like [Priapulus caudatus]